MSSIAPVLPSDTPLAATEPTTTATIPAQPSNPAPEWIRPPDFDVRMARVKASVPYDAATFPTLSREEQIAFYDGMMDAVRREFPDMPVGKVRGEPKGEGEGEGGGQEGGQGGGGWVEMVVDFGRLVKVCPP